MTDLEKEIMGALQRCSFLPGTANKRFVKQLNNWRTRDMTPAGRAYMLKLMDTYRRQIPNYQALKAKVYKMQKTLIGPEDLKAKA